MAHAPVIINDRPLSDWIIDLASGDNSVRRKAGLALCCYEHGISDPDELANGNDIERLVEPPNEEALKRAVREAFASDGFPVESVVAGLADYLIAANQAGLNALCGEGDDDVLADMIKRTKVFGVVGLVLTHAGSAAAPGVPSLIRMLTAHAECGIVSSGLPAMTAATALKNMGAAAAPAFDPLFDYFCEEGNETERQALAVIAQAVPELQARVLQLAANEDDDVRWAALEVLHEQGDASEETKAVAIEAIESTDQDVRHAAACILRRQFIDDPKAKIAMEQARETERQADDEDDDLLAPEHPLERNSQPLAYWIKQLAFGDESEQKEAHNCISAMHWGLLDVHLDIEDQEWGDVDSDEFHAGVLEAMSSDDVAADQVLRRLIDRLKESRARVNQRVKRLSDSTEEEITEWTALSFSQQVLEAVIENCGPAGAPAIDAITGLFSRGEENRSLSGTAAKALGSMGAAALPAFDSLLRSAGEWHGMQCPCPWRQALARIAGDSDEAVDMLVRGLSAPDQGVRKAAALALADTAPAHPQALAVAADRLAADTEGAPAELVRFVAVSSGESAVARNWIVSWMSHPEAGVRGTVASALEHFPDANEAAAHLASMAEDEDPYVRNSVLRAQCTLDIPDEVKVAQCLKRIDDWGGYDDWVPADNALWYLSNVGAAAAPALSALIAAVQQQQRCVDDILEVLHNVGPAARLALPLLRARLNEQLEWDPLMEDEDTVRLDMLIKELEK